MENGFLRPLRKSELDEIFDTSAQRIISDLLLTATHWQPPLVTASQVCPIQIPKEHLEQFVVQAIGATPVGAGSYPIDVLVLGDQKNFGADLKMLACRTNMEGVLSDSDSGEASLGQYFGRSDLDDLFNNNSRDEIKNIWMDILNNKYEQVARDWPKIKQIFYFFILRAERSFYLVGAELQKEALSQVTVDENRSTRNSVFLNGIIDNAYGSAKIYKAKKRLELRLTPSSWQKDSIKFSFSDSLRTVANLQGLIKLGRAHYNKHWDHACMMHKMHILNNN